MTRAACERGAVGIWVLIALVVLTGFSAFVIDYGIFWVSRAQAQNAADAGALAGAIARAFDDYNDLSDSGSGKQSAYAVATSNRVWLEPAPVQIGVDITFPEADCISVGGGDPTSSGAATPCIRVDVHRTAARDNPLPSFFGRLINVHSQDVKASAWGQVLMANVSDCVKPIAIPDRWGDFEGEWPDAGVKYDRYDLAGNPVGFDNYGPPDATNPGGFQHALPNGGLGTMLTFTQLGGPVGTPPRLPAMEPGFYVPVELPADPPGTFDFGTALNRCARAPMPVNTELPAPGGGVAGAVTAAARELLSRDPAARWNVPGRRIQDSCASEVPACAPSSPRLIALPVFDVDRYDQARQSGVLSHLQIVNIVGFFIEAVDEANNSVTGRIAFYPGRIGAAGAPSIAYGSSFLRAAMLVR